MVNAPAAWTAALDSDSPRFVVKHTFLDLQNSCAQTTFHRSCSDSALYNFTQQDPWEAVSADGRDAVELLSTEDEDVDFRLAGLSDGEEEETESTDSAYAVQPEPEPSQVAAAAAAAAALEPMGLESIASENARLLRENQMLLENARLASENARLRQRCMDFDGQLPHGFGTCDLAAGMSLAPSAAMTAPASLSTSSAIDTDFASARAASGVTAAPIQGWADEWTAAGPLEVMQQQGGYPYMFWLPAGGAMQPQMGFAPQGARLEATPWAADPWRAELEAPTAAPWHERGSVAARGQRRAAAPAAASVGASCAAASVKGRKGGDVDGRTTVMLRNMPNNYTRPMLLNLLDTHGFQGQYDFVYLPVDFKTRACLGYSFINLVDASLVPIFWSTFEGFVKWVIPSRKVCYVSWCSPDQGLEALVDRYRSSPVMHLSVPDSYKPLVFANGVAVEFPEPKKKARAPRVRTGGVREGQRK